MSGRRVTSQCRAVTHPAAAGGGAPRSRVAVGSPPRLPASLSARPRAASPPHRPLPASHPRPALTGARRGGGGGVAARGGGRLRGGRVGGDGGHGAGGRGPGAARGRLRARGAQKQSTKHLKVSRKNLIEGGGARRGGPGRAGGSEPGCGAGAARPLRGSLRRGTGRRRRQSRAAPPPVRHWPRRPPAACRDLQSRRTGTGTGTGARPGHGARGRPRRRGRKARGGAQRGYGAPRAH